MHKMAIMFANTKKTNDNDSTFVSPIYIFTLAGKKICIHAKLKYE